MASSMRKSTFPLDGSCHGSICKFDFGVGLYVCLFESSTLGLCLLIHVVPIEEERIFESWLCSYLVEISCCNVNLY